MTPFQPAMTNDVPAKVLLVSNTAWYIYNFRRNLAKRLQELGSEVVVVTPFDGYVEKLQQEGLRWVDWKLDRAGLNPLTNAASLLALWRIYRHESPQLVHHFTIKAILFGTTAAKFCRSAPIVNSVTGLGHIFTSQRLAARLLRPLVRRWYAKALTAREVTAMFQNSDDLALLSAASPRLKQQAILTRGSGVDVERFAPAASNGTSQNGTRRVLFAGRLIREKGIHEFLEAGRICKRNGLDVEFVICGKPDSGNPSSISEQELSRWKAEGLFRFVGHVDNMDEQIATSDVVVLPSYREGTPRVLLEAAAMGKPIIATDVPGCREVTIDGENGLLIPARDSAALASAMQRILMDDGLRQRLGRAGRRRIIQHFNERDVIAQMLQVYGVGTHSLELPQVAAAETIQPWTGDGERRRAA